MINLFDKIKERKYNDIIKIVKNEENIQLNIQDTFGNYLIEHILDTGDYELIKTILTKEISLDIIDTNGTTILYNQIKLDKMNILALIIEKSSKQIGIQILDKKDVRGRTALHYCVIFNNIKAFDNIIKSNGDPYISNTKGENIFFYCLKYERNTMLMKLFDIFSNFNMKNNEGETLLQSSINYSNYKIIDYLLSKTNININNQTKEGVTALHRLTGNNEEVYIKQLIELGADITISDYLGNNLLHYCIATMDNNHKLLNYYISLDKINTNFTNLDGNTPLHMYLIDYGKNVNKDILKKLIKKTNLNIQNHQGNTCLHLLTKYSLIESVEEELILKELNIFIQNYKGHTIYNKVENKDKILEIAAQSFFNILSSKNLIIDWEIKCSYIKDNNIGSYKSVNNSNELTKLKNTQDCLNKIKSTILKENRSLPKMRELNFDLDSGLVLKDCFFSGFPIDTLFGILWLKKSYPTISLVLDYPLSTNDNIEEFYSKMGINFNYKLDFINSMIIWGYQKIFFPEYFELVIKKEITNNSKVIVIPIGIETSQGAHTNILFWDRTKNIIERFEPNGKNPPMNYDYNPQLLDSILEQKFKNIDKHITYIKPSKYLPTIGFSMIENLEDHRCKKIGDPNGFCTAWCIWYCYQKLLNLDIDSETLVKQLINNIKLQAKSFKNLIRDFSKNISSYRDDFLEDINIDINDWILTNYTQDDLTTLEKNILKLL